jgi:hypothetical protein
MHPPEASNRTRTGGTTIDTEMTALTTAAAITIVIIELENRPRMMVSFYVAVVTELPG